MIPPRVVVLDEEAIALIESSWDPPSEWYESFELCDPGQRVGAARVGDVALVLSPKTTAHSRLLVIYLGEQNFFLRFTDEQRGEVFRRIRRAALHAYRRTVAIPHGWRVFTADSRISFHALPLVASQASRGTGGRLEIDRNPFGTPHTYVYNCSVGWHRLETSQPDKVAFLAALAAFQKCISGNLIAQAIASASTGVGPKIGIELAEHPYFHSENAFGFEEWYASRLTERQRKFVDAPESAPLRLRGAPGTGKTLALAVKLLKSAKRRLNASGPVNYLIVTYSTGTSAAIQSLIESLDNEAILSRLRDRGDGSSVEIRTMLDLAMGAIGAELHDAAIYPLATDGVEGRKMQMELIQSELVALRARGDWRVLKGTCSPPFVALVEASSESREQRGFAWGLMNEFACALDSDGVRDQKNRRQRYLSEHRPAWMLPLQTQGERQVVLMLYDAYREQLRQMSAISVDQLVSDYLNYLDSFRWDAIREKNGYDVVFVDELHLFNRQERMVFQQLTRRPRAEQPPIFMAYDAKQTSSDTFAPLEAKESESSFWGRLGLGGIERVELDKVFRYSPQIAEFVDALDRAFPALDLGGEWGNYDIHSQQEDSSRPTVTVLKDSLELYHQVFKRASAIKRKGATKVSVAVLCCSVDQFMLYREAGSLKSLFSVIGSKEDAAVSRTDPHKFVLSTPDYVAGLQFDVVLLTDVNDFEVPEGAFAMGARRRFLSTIYLGASRAKRHLELFATQEGGGVSGILRGARDTGVLVDRSMSGLAPPNEVV